jgi:endonuclease/exonuclease/phosphatase family metal-dependent hydrolase
MKMQLMTFNLRTNVPSDGINAWPYRVNKVVKIIEQVNPAVVGTQEVLPSMLSDLEGKLHSYNWVGEPRRENDEYSAIFYNRSDVELIKQGTFWISDQPSVPGSISWNSSCPRICTWAEFEWINQPKKRFRVFNTHLDHISEEAREKGSRLILESIKEANTQYQLPTVLMGDFNAYPEQPPVQFIRHDSQLIDCFSKFPDYDQIGKTFHGFEGEHIGKPIDYLFVTKEIKLLSIRVERTKVDGGFPSDHYPVIASLEF